MARIVKTTRISTAPTQNRWNYSAILSILVGLLIIIFPAALAWAVGLYLIIMGALELTKNY